MSLINLIKVEYSVGGPLLLDGVDFTLERNERMCVVGRNGAGKSTLLRLLAGEIKPDHGEVRLESGLRLARLAQELPRAEAGPVFDVVAGALGHIGAWLAEYHHLTQADGAEDHTRRLSEVQALIEAEHGWSLEQRVSNVLQRLQLPEDAEFATLSGGMQRRVLLARALVLAPDVLLLDEPTNHLDIDAIAWLEQLLLDFAGSVVFVTHDRRFLRALATRIVEIDRGQLTSWPGDYDNYLRRREERAHAESQANNLFDKKLAQEEVWIRQGIKARRTRSEGRVRALEAMRRERARRREAGGAVRMATNEAAGPGRKVIEADGATVALGGRVLVRDFSTMVMRGDRIGVIGPNGSGKTTLLKLLLGQLAPDEGIVKLGTNLEIAYFDQQRAQLQENLSASDNVADGIEFIEINGARKHVLGYLQEFLFSREQARAPITALSGGERNRLLLARLFAKPFNVLVMDEPTNDLDIETLELLEELLAGFSGTLLLVSHDREFIDNVVTSTLVLEGDGKVGEYVGGYSDWMRQRAPVAPAARPAGRGANEPQSEAKASKAATAPAAKRKLSYKDARELADLPQHIEMLETRLAALSARMHEPSFYQAGGDAIVAANTELAALQAELEQAYERWQALL